MIEPAGAGTRIARVNDPAGPEEVAGIEPVRTGTNPNCSSAELYPRELRRAPCGTHTLPTRSVAAR